MSKRTSNRVGTFLKSLRNGTAAADHPLRVALLALGFALACEKAPAPAAPTPDAASKPADAHSVPLNKGVEYRCMPVPEVADLLAWLPAQSVHEASQQAILTAPVSGVITGSPQVPGRPVAKGAVLLELRSPELAELKSRWLKAQAHLRRAEADLARERRLAAAQAGSARELEHAEAEQAAAQSEAEAAAIAIQARGLSPEQAGDVFQLRAPMAGVVAEWKAVLGQGVAMHEALGSFQTGSATQVLLELPPPSLQAWKLGSRTQARDNAGTVWNAEVVGLPPGVTPGTHRLSYRLALAGAKLPLPGSPLEVKVPVGRGSRIPTSALQQVEGVWGVFLREAETARFQAIQRGPDTERDTLILGGLPPGAKVILDGAFLLKSQLLRQQAGGHE